ncbi:MAG: DEAD/DEAH box helicase family protein, partial [Veillonella sp.]|nr:DEAD/DEAH box helicase family protein [Veillonella sp.]
MIIDVNSQMVNFHQAPEFIYNNHLTGQKVLSVIEDELKRCQSFTISVAFITMGGLTPLLQTLKELEQRGVPGRVLTTDYLGFNDPKVLEKLASLKNIELRVYCSAKSSYGFHTKGYIFQNEADYKIIIGSSNLTAGALTINKEWNTKVQSLEDDNYTQKILKEFEAQWTSPYTLSYEEFIPWYRTEWVKQEVQKTRITLPQVAEPTYQSILRPNAMQSVFIENLRALRAKGERRGLLISATGTGKTYASAFALKDMKPKRILFVVHREQIAKQARESYRRVFNQPSDNFGLLSGSHKDLTKPYLFGT